jgi:hypothetical protein
MRYITAPDIWQMNDQQIAAMQPGQWVFAGEPNNRGIYLGTTSRGTVVVAWTGNIANHGRNRLAYIRSLRQYAKNG